MGGLMFKKILPFLLGLFLVLVFTVLAATPAQAVEVFVNHNKVLFDAAPFIEEGRTLVPVRGIFETMGAQVDWNPDQQAVKVQKDNLL
jgi:hypothetical protein